MVQLTISPIATEGSINVESWLQQISEKYSLKNIEFLRQAAPLVRVVGTEHAAPNGESCLQQGLTMAEILAELNVDTDTLAAAMLYSSVCYAGLSLEDVTEHLNEKIAKLIKGTQQMEAINILRVENYHSHDPATIDNIRKMLLAMVDDANVVLIKLAERLCLLRNVAIFNDAKKKQMAKETMDIYAPLANRLGIGQIKWQLEDLSFRYLEPQEYKKISTLLNQRRIDREQHVQHMVGELTTLLQEADIHNFNITGRAKHIYSIYRKMNRKKVAIEEIYDISAVRIFVTNINDCYAVLSSVHTRWPHVPKEFDDYIATPKPNGYRSIHTAVIGPENKPVEIQIRTHEMHEAAELGVAAHWIYKEGRRKPSSYEEKISWLRQVMDWQKEIATTQAAKKELQTELFDDRVYVFTPTGDVLDLPKGATPLDFAYQLHSELGHRCRGAKVNKHIVPLTYSLNTGEQVDILTIKHGQPSRDWLNPSLGYLKTPRAKAKVLQWFKRQDYDKNLAEGKLLLEKEQRRLNLKNFDFENVAHKLNYKNSNDCLAAIGRGDLGIQGVVNLIQSQFEPPAAPIEIKPDISKSKISQHLTDIDIHGVGNLLTHIARCCKPVPGDAIVGYVTIGRGVSIHRQDCSNVLHYRNANQERLLDVNWGQQTQKNYAVDLDINAYDRQGLLRDITAFIASENIAVLSINTFTNQEKSTAHIHITIEISDLAYLGKILAHLQQIPNVFEVKRAN